MKRIAVEKLLNNIDLITEIFGRKNIIANKKTVCGRKR